MTDWHVYIIKCTDGTLYTGIARDVEKRFQQHIGLKGAKFFRGHTPDRVVYIESGFTRSTASKREYEIKTFTRTEKLRLIADGVMSLDGVIIT